MFDSPEKERQLDASEIMRQRDQVIDIAIQNMGKATMVSDNVANLDSYRHQKQALAQVATNNAVNDQERLSA